MTDTCTRSPDAPFYLRSWSWKWLFLLVPSYTLISAFRNLQPLTRQSKVLKQIVAMIFISSASYAGVLRHLVFPIIITFLLTDSLFSANRVSSRYFSRSDSVTAVGAVVVGLLGNLYSRIFKGYAYPTMVPGVLFLIPVCHSKLAIPSTNLPFALSSQESPPWTENRTQARTLRCVYSRSPLASPSALGYRTTRCIMRLRSYRNGLVGGGRRRKPYLRFESSLLPHSLLYFCTFSNNC